MNPHALMNCLSVLTAAIAVASAMLISMPVGAQTAAGRELDLAQAERFGLTLPWAGGNSDAAGIERAKATHQAELRRARAAGELPAFRAELYGLTLPRSAPAVTRARPTGL